MQRNANNTSTSYSNLAFEEFFSDKLEYSGPTLLSQTQNKLLSQQNKNIKVKNEKQR